MHSQIDKIFVATVETKKTRFFVATDQQLWPTVLPVHVSQNGDISPEFLLDMDTYMFFSTETKPMEFVIHPRKLAWHLKTDPWKRRFLLDLIGVSIIFRVPC